MPLPKMPTKPATLLPVNEYPKAEPGKSPVRALAAAPVAADPVEDLISGKAVPASKSSRARKGKAAPLAAVPSPQGESATWPTRAETGTNARLKETDQDEPHPAKHKPVEVTVKSSTSRKADRSGKTKVFVLDTNVLMHDPTSLFRFEEHDVYLPMMTLEELDDHKKGMSEVARNARQVSRTLDALIADIDDDGIEAGIELAKLGNKDAKGRLFFQTKLQSGPLLPEGLPVGKADNQILGVVKALAAEQPERAIVLVSKDINMRIKARALGLPAEDYFNDHVLEDTDLLYSGIVQLPDDFWDKHSKNMESWQENKNGNNATFYRVNGPFIPSLLTNQFVFLEPSGGEAPMYAQVKEINGKTAVFQVLRDYSHTKNSVWGITARNREQNFALNLLMNPECDFVTLLGQAGTGKTLLALAAGLAQVLETKLYNEIIVTRVTVPVGEDIGFLPGTEEEKMSPWMGAFDDNLEVLNKSDSDAGDWGRAATQDLIRSRIKIKSLNFMRGRTFVNKFLIIDEAQNLTPKQMKTLVTRAGPGTKILCLGNIAQIDTPYLTEGSSGLTYVVDRFKGWSHSGHVTLARGERSRLADHASDVL
ncbi:PhoH family protein [Massilia sp. Leaf139]|uniref:PhoH family protein n=1 Tax=Massilia sp. Leaf139 TaxID=1736272 RepID=UPI0006FDBC97|nr:PhoH family protein [Massilia sp. Leaf139]KQQ96592.1 phosphate starvation-inducible protein PhoH [Massilia sp. Leaf139]